MPCTQHNAGTMTHTWGRRMQTRMRMATRLFVMAITIAILGLGFSTHDQPPRGFAAAQPANCSQSVPTTGNRTVNIAMLFWGPPASDMRFTAVNGSARIVWPRNPMLDGWNGPSTVEIRFYRAYQLWVERMELPAAYGGGPGLIMLDGSVMRFNLTWFNVGEFSSVRGPGEFTPTYQNSRANKLITQLADPNGPYGRQHFMLSPLISNSQVTILASLACEASGTCMMVSPGAAESRQFICQDPMPQDCVQRGRRKGSRRFENTVSAYSNADYWASGSMSLVVNQGFKRIFAIGELWSVNAMTQMAATAKLLGMRVVGTMAIATLTKDWGDYNTSSAQITQRIQDLSVDMVVILNTFEGTTALVDLLRYWRSINYLPNAVAFLTGGASYLPPDLAAYFLVEVLWLPTLTGAQYRAVSSDTTFETFPANATHDSPAVFADAFTKRFGYRPALQAFPDSARAMHAVTIVQKLLDLAQTEDTESLKRAAARIATPGAYHAVQFDQWGRSLPFDNYVLQLLPEGEERVLTPLGLGSTPIFPIPGWSEREFHPVFLAKTSERIAFGLSAVTVAYLLGWLVWLALHRHHPLIRVAAPVCNAFSLCGLIVLACACFFATSVQSDVTCATFEWLFILGLTFGFAPLVLKNLRIWSMWNNRASFAPAPIKQRHTMSCFIILLLLDVALLSAWQASTGFRAHRVQPDPYRPSLDYSTCGVYTHSRGFVIGAMSWKLLMFACAMYLAYLLRNVSAKYSESRFVALCIYNATLTLSVFIPVSASDAAGRDTPLVRVYLLIFLCASTASIMLVPKFLAIHRCAPQIQHTNHPHKTQAETQLPSPAEGGAAAAPTVEEQHAATEPRHENTSHAGSAQPPVRDAVVPPPNVPGLPRSLDLRHAAPVHPRQDSSLGFQSMLGLSQVERRYVDEESEMTQLRAPRAEQGTRVPEHPSKRRPPGGGLSSPAPLLDAIPQSPQGTGRRLHGSQSAQNSDFASESKSTLQQTLDLIHTLPLDEVAQLHSTLVQRRRQSASASNSGSGSSAASGSGAPSGAASGSPVVHLHYHSPVPTPALSVRSITSATFIPSASGSSFMSSAALGFGFSSSSGGGFSSSSGSSSSSSSGHSSGSSGMMRLAFPRGSPPMSSPPLSSPPQQQQPQQQQQQSPHLPSPPLPPPPPAPRVVPTVADIKFAAAFDEPEEHTVSFVDEE